MKITSAAVDAARRRILTMEHMRRVAYETVLRACGFAVTHHEAVVGGERQQ